jgi:hypothetical protein
MDWTLETLREHFEQEIADLREAQKAVTRDEFISVAQRMLDRLDVIEDRISKVENVNEQAERFLRNRRYDIGTLVIIVSVIISMASLTTAVLVAIFKH